MAALTTPESKTKENTQEGKAFTKEDSPPHVKAGAAS